MIENKTDIENETFNYSYSSIRREEIEKIRNKYIQNQEDDLNELRRLDNHITNTATFAAIFVGIMGLLVFWNWFKFGFKFFPICFRNFGWIFWSFDYGSRTICKQNNSKKTPR